MQIDKVNWIVQVSGFPKVFGRKLNETGRNVRKLRGGKSSGANSFRMKKMTNDGGKMTSFSQND